MTDFVFDNEVLPVCAVFQFRSLIWNVEPVIKLTDKFIEESIGTVKQHF